MKYSVLGCLIILFIVVTVSAQSEWSGSVKQGYQKRQQFIEPKDVRSWLDTVSSATLVSSEQGPVTETEIIYAVDLPEGSWSAGLYSRWLWYSAATYQAIVLPILNYQDEVQDLKLGNQQSATWGSGLLIGAYPVAGLTYKYKLDELETEIYYYAEFELSDFQKERINYIGLSETFQLSRGKIGLLYNYDFSPEFEDFSRTTLITGGAISLIADWVWPNNWYTQAEVVLGEHVGVFAGWDIAVFDFLSLQARMRYVDENFTLLMSRFSRDGTKETCFSLRVPLVFYSEQLIIRPEWGLKHTADQDFWVPGIKLAAAVLDAVWIEGKLFSEQPLDRWGDFNHYEYVDLKLIWMITNNWTVNVGYTKIFNGFLEWKNIISQAEVNYSW